MPVGITENLENLVSLIGNGSYPINLESSDTLNTVSRGMYYYVLTDTRLNAFTNGGKEIYSHSHGFESPVLKTSATRAMVFDQGGNEAYIYNLKEQKQSLKTDTEIINAAISDSGVYAVITRSESYASVVTVYSRGGKKIYTWYSSSDTVNNVAIAPNGKKIAITAFNAANGKFNSKICILNFNSANPINTVNIEGGPIMTLESFHRAGFIAATENKLVFTVMQESTATFYPGKLNILDQEAADREKAQTVNMEAMKNFRFIQNFRDEFLELREKEKRSVFSWENLNVSVITNSDYIMEKMLKETGLCNISGSYLSNDKQAANKGIPLEFKKNKVVFGYIRRKNDETDELMEELLGFLREKLKLENGS